MQELELQNKLNTNINIENKQKNFLNTTLGKAINTGLNMGLRYLLPDLIEEQVIDIKDTILKQGFKSGVQKAINSAIDLGKSAVGIVSGNFENMEQVQDAIRSGGIIDTLSGVINDVVDKCIVNEKIPNQVGTMIKQGKNVILDGISRNIESELQNQSNDLELMEKYMKQWKEYYNNKDFIGMEKEFDKLEDKIKEIIPIENTIKEARVIENVHNLIKNNGQNFNLTQEQKELAKIL